MQFNEISLQKWPPRLGKPLLYSLTQIYLHFSLPFPCTHVPEKYGWTNRLSLLVISCFLTVDMPKILWLWVHTGNKSSGIRIQNLYPSHPYRNYCSASLGKALWRGTMNPQDRFFYHTSHSWRILIIYSEYQCMIHDVIWMWYTGFLLDHGTYDTAPVSSLIKTLTLFSVVHIFCWVLLINS